MENVMNLKENDFEKNENIFYLDYDAQRMDDNIEYKNWKESMLKYYGRDAKLFRCLNDKILFYIKYNDNSLLYGSFIRCPICKQLICYYCSYYNKHEYSDIYCCLKSSIVSHFYKGLKYKIGDFDLKGEFLISLIPGILIFATIHRVFYLMLNISSKKNKNNRILKGSFLIENNSYYTFIRIIAFLLSIPLIILNIYFILFGIIPFNFYLIKCISGFYNG